MCSAQAQGGEPASRALDGGKMVASTPSYDWYSTSLNQPKCIDPFGQSHMCLVGSNPSSASRAFRARLSDVSGWNVISMLIGAGSEVLVGHGTAHRVGPRGPRAGERR